MGGPVHVLFACTQNAGRSQMAAAFFNALVDPAKARGLSAGTHPADQIHGNVREVMEEVGIDLADARPRSLEDAVGEGVDVLVTMGCGVACPTLPGVETLAWSFEDPSGASADAVRRIRDGVRDHIVRLLEERDWLNSRKKSG
ncbi:MAG TPA: arsenate reductase ArsC [Planctomycetes bacterium]|nr:arsenate reductase ArsC [Planctomycetota bacterium]